MLIMNFSFCVFQIDYVKVCIEDSPFANLSYYFDRIADKIEEVRRRGGNTLVHCVAGISRSASLCIAYMMKYKRMPLRKAYQHVKVRICEEVSLVDVIKSKVMASEAHSRHHRLSFN